MHHAIDIGLTPHIEMLARCKPAYARIQVQDGRMIAICSHMVTFPLNPQVIHNHSD